MRECPSHIAKSLREYDELLVMKWDQKDHLWWFWRGDTRLFPYRHIDGLDALNDLSVDEIMFIIRRSDNHRNFDVRRKELAAARQRVVDSDKRADQRGSADCERETANIADFYRRDKQAKPFIGPLSFASI